MNPPLINARAETLAKKPAFRTSFKSKRGIVIMSGYFEWQQLEHYKQPYYIMLKNNKLLAVAALGILGSQRRARWFIHVV